MTTADKMATEVTGCDASIMKNVWEIRLREYGQRLQVEQERVEKSALETINKDWQKRMTSNQKYPKRSPRKPKPVETAEVQSYASRRMGALTGRGAGYLGAQSQKPAPISKALLKSEKVQRLLSLSSSQPSSMIWSKSWKFTNSLPQPVEGSTPPADWGESWQFITLQPHIEGKPWTGENSATSDENINIWQKPMRMLDSQHFEESLQSPEWGMSWKYTKPQNDLKSGAEDESNKKSGLHDSKSRLIETLVESQHHNEALSSSEWNESWKATKPSEDGEAHTSEPVNGPSNEPQDSGKPGSQSIECWKFINRQLHVNDAVKQTVQNPEWADSWRAAKKVSKNNKKAKSDEHSEYGGAQDFDHDQEVIMFVSREYKNSHLLAAQLSDENGENLSEWEKSWETTKCISKPSSDPTLKPEEPKDKAKVQTQKAETKKENVAQEQLDMYKTTIMSKKSKYRNLLSRLLIDEMPYEWNSAWKFTKPDSSKETVQWLTPGIADASMILKQHLKKRSLTDWSESWKCARAHSHHATPSVTEWKESWFSRFQPHVSREHWIKEAGLQEFDKKHPKYEVFNLPQRASAEKIFHRLQDVDKDMGSEEWKESWKSLKQTECCMVPDTQLNHDNTFMTEWTDSWRCAVFHPDVTGQEQPRQNWLDELMEIKPRIEKLKVSMSRSFESQVFAERYPQTQWNESWKKATLQHHHHQKTNKVMETAKSSLFHLDNTNPSPPDWNDSWKCVCMHFNQNKEIWDMEFAMYIQAAHAEIESQTHMDYDEGKNDVQLINYTSKWGESWKMANPMPNVEKGSWIQSHENPSKYVVLWSRSKSKKQPLQTTLNDTATLRLWGKSWRFLMMEGKKEAKAGKGKSNASNGFVIAIPRIKTRKHIYNDIDKEKPSERRWVDSHKITKTQPRPKRDAFMKMPKVETNKVEDFTEKWAESWRFSNKPVIQKKEDTATVSTWGESWKFLIPPYTQQNGPKSK